MKIFFFSFFKIKECPLKIWVFAFLTILLFCLTVVSFFAAFAQEEGTLGNKNFIWTILANIYWVLRFPTHTLLWFLMSIPFLGTLFFLLGLILNSLIYAFLLERIICLGSYKLKLFIER